MGIDRSCRLFPDLENTRYKRDTGWALISHSAAQMNRSQYRNPVDSNLTPIAMPKLPENNGLCKFTCLNVYLTVIQFLKILLFSFEFYWSYL